jgi:hypothetical protein
MKTTTNKLFRFLTFVFATILLTSLTVTTMTIIPSYGQELLPPQQELEQQQEITRGITSGEFRNDPRYGIVSADSWVVTLRNETFAPIEIQPQFADKDKITPSNIPEERAQIVPQLK